MLDKDMLSKSQVESMSGYGHMLSVSSKRARRISHSTSHAESLAQFNGVQTAETIAMRFTEIAVDTSGVIRTTGDKSPRGEEAVVPAKRPNRGVFSISCLY